MEDRETAPPDLTQPCHTPSAHAGLGNPTCSDHQGHIWGAAGKGVIPAPGPGSSSPCQLYIRARFRFWSRKKKKKKSSCLHCCSPQLAPSLGPFTQKHTFSMTFFNEIFDNIAAQEFTALFPCEIFGSFLAFAVHAAVRSRDRSRDGERPAAPIPDAWPVHSAPSHRGRLRSIQYFYPPCLNSCAWKEVEKMFPPAWVCV